MLLMTSNTRSGGVGQGRASFARRASGRSEAQSLDGRRSGGYPATDAQGRFPLFSTGSPAVTSGCCTATFQDPFPRSRFVFSGYHIATLGCSTAPILGWRVPINPMRSMVLGAVAEPAITSQPYNSQILFRALP